MEDEHICIDDLVVELGAGADASAGFLFSGAFYGVSYFLTTFYLQANFNMNLLSNIQFAS